MKPRRLLVCAGILMSSLFLFIGLQLALQRADATLVSGSDPLDSPLATPDYLVNPLNSPLLPPETLPDIEEEPVDIEALTYKTYLPSIYALQNKFGTEVDSEFANYRGADKIEQAGFGWYRHMQVSWAAFEPISGVYTMTPGGPGGWYQALDDGLARAVASGLQPIVVIRDSPAWATEVLTRGCKPITPTLYTHFADFVNKVIDKYEQPPYNVRYYELFNEPDIPTFITDTEKGCWTVSKYVSMTQAVYPTVKAVHPNVSILNGGLYFHGDTWSRTFIETGLDFVDVLAYHAYESPIPTSTMWFTATGIRQAQYLIKLDKLRAWINQYHPDKNKIPIFMNEGGLINSDPSIDQSSLKLVQAYFAAFMAAQVTGEDLEQYSWWRSWWDSDLYLESAYGRCFTTTEAPNTTIYETNQLYTALQFSLAQVRNAVYVTTTRSITSASFIKLQNANQKDLWLMWNTNTSASKPFTYTFSAPPYRVWDVWGGELQISTSLYMTDPLKVVWVQPNE